MPPDAIQPKHSPCLRANIAWGGREVQSGELDGSSDTSGKEQPRDIEGHKWPQSWQDEKWYALAIPVSHATSLEAEGGWGVGGLEGEKGKTERRWYLC